MSEYNTKLIPVYLTAAQLDTLNGAITQVLQAGRIETSALHREQFQASGEKAKEIGLEIAHRLKYEAKQLTAWQAITAAKDEAKGSIAPHMREFLQTPAESE